VLADVGVEPDDEVGPTVEQRGEGTAGADGGELPGVADKHQRGAGALDREHEPGEVGVVGHAGLVDHDDGALVEDDLAVVAVPQQRCERPRLHAHLGAEVRAACPLVDVPTTR
jgi:hypothetical protein